MFLNFDFESLIVNKFAFAATFSFLLSIFQFLTSFPSFYYFVILPELLLIYFFDKNRGDKNDEQIKIFGIPVNVFFSFFLLQGARILLERGEYEFVCDTYYKSVKTAPGDQ